MIIMNRRLVILLFALVAPTEGFSPTSLFQREAALKVTAPAKETGVEIELPDFDELFSRIQKASPLARLAMDGGELGGKRGLAALESPELKDELKWKTVESNKNGLVHKVEKIDNHGKLPAPLLRFRCNVKGPCHGGTFSNFLTNQEFRSKWDTSLADIFEAHPIEDLDAVNKAIGVGSYGVCSEIGVGYCTTKPSFGVTSREQLTMCGVQDFPDGSCIIWGTEMCDRLHNHLLPDTHTRRTRAKSHLFATTLTPLGDGTFDVEYVIQLEIGGNLPVWATTPVVIDNVKNMFKVVHPYFGEEMGVVGEYQEELEKDPLVDPITQLDIGGENVPGWLSRPVVIVDIVKSLFQSVERYLNAGEGGYLVDELDMASIWNL